MSFKKGWVEQFAVPSDLDARVRDAMRAPGRSKKPKPATQAVLPPVLEVKSLADLPDELTVAEVAKKLRVSVGVVYERIAQGKLFAQKEGHDWRIPLWSLAQYMAERPANVA